MATTIIPLATETLDDLVALLASHRASAARSAESLYRETAAALSERDGRELLDLHDPAVNPDVPALVMLLRHARARLREAEQALDRLADGTFGRCHDCGDAIPIAALTARPTTVVCVECSRNPSWRVARGSSAIRD